MRGAIAAGHPLTAAAGALVLGEGGNAVDAAVAAALVSWVAESPLTGPGAGGFMLVHRGRDRSTRVLDFFTAVPGLGGDPVEGHAIESVDVDFSGATTQHFRIGGATVAVPGAALGLEQAQRSYGTLAWRDLFAPAIELARNGVELTSGQAYLHEILDLILRHTPEARAIYEREDGEGLVLGDVLVQRDLAATLELIRDGGARVLYEGGLAHAIVDHVRASDGALTERDLAEYRVIRRRPVRAGFRDHEFLSNPPPSAGGSLIAFGLGVLDDVGTAGGAEAIDALARVMGEQQRVLADGFHAALRNGGLARVLARHGGVVNRGTTHISVLDAAGNAASMTASTGAGSGVVVPGTGIHLNNMIGEFIDGGTRRAGMRLSSGMSPSLVLRSGRPRLVVGSAGSFRLRGAVMQVVVNVVQHGLDVREAIERPRVHLDEENVLQCEGGNDRAEVDRLEAMGWDVARWDDRNLYFGGAAAVELAGDDRLAAAGDPRRGGAGVVVE
ncbi:MAG TPA: gamma-glutamyltransferase [Gaiellaceae bacterium]|nr:gamma-glutamyltransferase [Gaiellaceae bacterium]